MLSVFLLALVTACGNDTVNGSGDSSDGPRTTEGALDTTEAERMLVARQKQANPDLSVGEARCPAHAELRKGATFGCSVLVEGLPAPYTVTVTDVNRSAKTAEYKFQLNRAVLSTAKLNEAMRQSLSDKSAKVDCGPGKARLAAVGATIECSITDGDGSRSGTLRVEDLEGKVTPV